MDPLDRLRRTDKWFLGDGVGRVWAPPFPRWREAVGFWDETYLADVRMERLLTVLAFDRRGREVRLRGELVDWRPDRLKVVHRSPLGELHEWRYVAPGAFGVELHWRGSEPVELVAWSAPDVRPAPGEVPWRTVTEATSEGYTLRTVWPAELAPDRTGVDAERLAGSGSGSPVDLHVRIALSLPARGGMASAQRHDVVPEARAFPRGVHADVRLDEEGVLHLWRGTEIGPGGRLVVAAGVDRTPERASASAHAALAGAVTAERAWQGYFREVPNFTAEDPFLTHAYWYRWYGLRLNLVAVPGLSMANGEPFAPFVTEGVGFFRNFVSYSAQAHGRELAWHESPELAQATLENLRRTGPVLAGHTYTGRPARDFYHCDPSAILLRLRANHGVSGEEFRPWLAGYLGHLTSERAGPAGSVLVRDQNETGQEYMSRYQEARADADRWGEFALGGVDATVYALRIAEWLEDKRAGPLRAALEQMWDGEFYADLLPERDGWRRSPARPATGLYALLADSSRARELVRRWIGNPEEFWGSAGFPATAASDPTYSAQGVWKGRRLNCPWNGRSWPMANSHLVEGLVRAARRESDLRPFAAEALTKAVRLMFHNGEPSRPNSYEHYDPETGAPSLYRGYDDYMHSWIVDLILTGVVGFDPEGEGMDPLPGLGDWEIEGVPRGGKRVSARMRNGRVSLL